MPTLGQYGSPLRPAAPLQVLPQAGVALAADVRRPASPPCAPTRSSPDGGNLVQDLDPLRAQQCRDVVGVSARHPACQPGTRSGRRNALMFPTIGTPALPKSCPAAAV